MAERAQRAHVVKVAQAPAAEDRHDVVRLPRVALKRLLDEPRDRVPGPRSGPRGRHRQQPPLPPGLPPVRALLDRPAKDDGQLTR